MNSHEHVRVEQAIASGWSDERIIATLGVAVSDIERVCEYLDRVHSGEPLKPVPAGDVCRECLRELYRGEQRVRGKVKHEANGMCITCCRRAYRGISGAQRLLDEERAANRREAERLDSCGLKAHEIAEMLGVGTRTIQRYRAERRAIEVTLYEKETQQWAS